MVFINFFICLLSFFIFIHSGIKITNLLDSGQTIKEYRKYGIRCLISLIGIFFVFIYYFEIL